MARLPRNLRPTPILTRSRVVLEIASELVADRDQPYNQAKVMLRAQGATDWPLALFGSSTVEGVDAVVKGEAALAIINPAAALGFAYRGEPPFTAPQPVRSIGVIPTSDQIVFAVSRDFGLTSVEDIAANHCPLILGLRGQHDHWLHAMLDHVLAAAGCSLDDIRSWGGGFTREGMLPYPDGPRFGALVDGTCNAIFDEAAHVWLNEAAQDFTILALSEATVIKLEALGYRRSTLSKKDYPGLPADVLSLEFSGWPIFVHAQAPDLLVTRICAALDARKHNIPWEEEGPLPVERMCLDAPDTPQHVPLHRAAADFWRQCGYLV